MRTLLMKKTGLILLCCVGILVSAGAANALVFDLTLPEFSSPYHDPGTYFDPYLVGHFAFDLMGEQIVLATISGQWGNSESSTTAHNLLFVDGLQIADTHDYTPDPYWNGGPWSYTFSDFSTLEDGLAFFITAQTSEYIVRLDETTLHIESASVPEPATVLLLGSGLLGLAWFRRKFRKS